MAFEVNSVPLSDTIICGLPRTLTIMVSSRATRLPEIDVSGIAARHSAETAPLVDEIAQTSAQLDLRRPARAIADHLAIGSDEEAGPALAHLHDVTQIPF